MQLRLAAVYLSASQDKKPSERQISGGFLIYTLHIMETSNKKAVLAYIRNNPGCTATAVANEVFGKWRWSGWIFARNDISALCDEGLVNERSYRGISVFYPVEKKEAA